MNRITTFDAELDYFVNRNNLQPADAILVKREPTRLLNHYIIYLGTSRGKHIFMANTLSGIRIFKYQELMHELQTFQPVKIERFVGSNSERDNAVERALMRKDENSYDLILNNCEHFKNWVQKGNSSSEQVASALGLGLLVFGLAWAFGDE